MLFEKLEQCSPQAAGVIRETFGGVLVNQIISKEGNFTSERNEAFNMITLAVQGKASVVESLEMLVTGDLLSGDNKYQLPNGKKVRLLHDTTYKSRPLPIKCVRPVVVVMSPCPCQ